MMPITVCAAVTIVSALVSLGYSVEAVRSATGEAHTLSLYALARSAALAAVSAIALITRRPDWIIAAAVGMIIVQGCDALIGVMIKDRIKTFGPALTAIVNLAALIWLAH